VTENAISIIAKGKKTYKLGTGAKVSKNEKMLSYRAKTINNDESQTKQQGERKRRE